jgi:hypothetical protein
MEALKAVAQSLTPEVQAILEAGLQDHTAQALAAAQTATVASDVVDHEALRQFRKLRPTVFSHREVQDPIDWMYEVEMLMDLAELPNEETKVAAIPLVLVGRALIWWKSEEAHGTIPEYFTGEGGFKEYFLAYHSSPDPARKVRDQLDELKQTKSVSHYTAQFRSLISRARMTDEEIRHRYVKHLKDEVRQHVSLGLTTGVLNTFEKIAAYAEAADTVIFENKRRGTKPSSNEAQRNRGNQRYQVQHYSQQKYAPNPFDNNGAAPMDLSALPNGERLSPELKIKLIREGKCFYCRTGTHLAINCPLKKQHRSPNGRRQ